MQPAANFYQKTQVTTASPEQLLIMLYDGALRFLGQARSAIGQGEGLVKREALSKAMAIIAYLAETLDHEAGWNSSEELDALYAYMVKELTRVNLQEDLKALGVVEELLQGLRGTWVEAIEQIRREKSPVAASPGIPVEGYQALSVSL